MAELLRKPIKRKTCNITDVNGNRFSVSSDRNNHIRFTLYHSQILEKAARQEYEYISLRIDPTISIFSQLGDLYEKVGNSFVPSSDPIRDGGNYIILEADQEKNSYFLTFCRDLSNDLNLPLETNVVLAAQPFQDFYDEISKEELEIAKQYKMKLTH